MPYNNDQCEEQGSHAMLSGVAFVLFSHVGQSPRGTQDDDASVNAIEWQRSGILVYLECSARYCIDNTLTHSLE